MMFHDGIAVDESDCGAVEDRLHLERQYDDYDGFELMHKRVKMTVMVDRRRSGAVDAAEPVFLVKTVNSHS